jgi:multiple sugar transport system substrate-binding protein
LERFHKRPPRTWAEYHDLVEFFARRENLADLAPPADAPWHATIEPLAAGWAGRLLLARAAAAVKHRDHYSTLFKIDTMEPLVDGPGFVRALEQLVADARLAGAGDERLDVDGARRAFLAGQSALALAWPAHPGAERADGANLQNIGFAELSGSEQVYDIANKIWETRAQDESPHVTLLGLAGRMGAIVQTSVHPSQAFQLLAWLAGTEWGAEVSAASAATTLFRRSQMRLPQAWVDRGIDAQAAGQYTTSVRDALTRSSYLFALRIPGHEQYLAALDVAVEQALRDKASPAKALAATAEKWRAINQQLGVETQRVAYCRSLGCEP